MQEKQGRTLKTPAMQLVLDYCASHGRWHSAPGIAAATKLSGPATSSAIGACLKAGWMISRDQYGRGWGKDYSITTTGDQARQGVEQIGLVT